MSSRFLELGGDGGADLSILQTGSFSINVANIIDQSLTPNLPVVANAAKVLTSRLITLADLDFIPITNPNQGDLTIIGNLISENVISNNLNLNNFAQQTNDDIILLNDKTQNITAIAGLTTLTNRLQINTPSNQPSIIMQGRLVQFGGVSIPTFDIIADRPGGMPDAETINLINYRASTDLNTNALIARISMAAVGNITATNFGAEYAIQTCNLNSNDVIPRFKIGADNATYITGNLNISEELIMNNNRIKLIADPIDDTDVASKIYVDGLTFGTVKNPMIDFLDCNGFDILGAGIMECKSIQLNGDFLHSGINQAPNYIAQYNKPIGILNNDIIFQADYNTNLGPVAGILIRANSNHSVANRSTDYIIQTCLTNNITTVDRIRIAADNNTYITGGLIMDGNRIQSIANPINNNDAANKIYVDNSLGNVVRNPMQIDLDGGQNGVFGITFIECDSINILSAGFELNGGFLHKRNTSPIFFQSVYDRPTILDNEEFYRADYGITGGNNSRVIITSSGDQSISNRGCDYTIQTCLDNTTITVDRFKIAADNNTYITGGLIMDDNRIQSIANPINNNDAANKIYVDNSVKLDWDVVPILLLDDLLPSASRDYYINEEVPYKIVISQMKMQITSQGSSNTRVAIYRGSDNSAILVGQSNLIPASQLTLPYFKYTIIPEIGQNLTFQKGENIVIAMSISGNTTRFAAIRTDNEISISWYNNTNSVTSGFPNNPRAKSSAMIILPGLRLISN